MTHQNLSLGATLSNFQLFKLEILLRWPVFTFIFNHSSNMNYFIHTSYHFTPHGTYELNKLISLPIRGVIAQLVEHRAGIAISNWLNWKIYCDYLSSLSSTTAVQIWIISYILLRLPTGTCIAPARVLATVKASRLILDCVVLCMQDLVSCMLNKSVNLRAYLVVSFYFFHRFL